MRIGELLERLNGEWSQSKVYIMVNDVATEISDIYKEEGDIYLVLDDKVESLVDRFRGKLMNLMNAISDAQTYAERIQDEVYK